MNQIVYRIVEHNGGWAYALGDVFSETFASRDEATEAAKQAAASQERAGQDEHIEYEDAGGVWHEEDSPGTDRPDTAVDTPGERDDRSTP